MEQIFNQEFINLLSIFFRIALSAFFGGMIGAERVKKKRPAGIKTHAFVAMGSTLVMLTGEFLALKYQSTDVSRLAAQVVSGVGFLGAGTIMVTGRSQIKGLTTAAGLWFSAALGIAIGAEFYSAVFISMFMVYMITHVFSKYDQYLQHHSNIMDVYVEFNDEISIGTILKNLRFKGIQISEIEILNEVSSRHLVLLTLKLPDKWKHLDALKCLEELNGIVHIEEV